MTFHENSKSSQFNITKEFSLHFVRSPLFMLIWRNVLVGFVKVHINKFLNSVWLTSCWLWDMAPRDFSLHLEVLRKAAKFETRISSALFFLLTVSHWSIITTWCWFWPLLRWIWSNWEEKSLHVLFLALWQLLSITIKICSGVNPYHTWKVGSRLDNVRVMQVQQFNIAQVCSLNWLNMSFIR